MDNVKKYKVIASSELREDTTVFLLNESQVKFLKYLYANEYFQEDEKFTFEDEQEIVDLT